jgi:hypothetical protein
LDGGIPAFVDPGQFGWHGESHSWPESERWLATRRNVKAGRASGVKIPRAFPKPRFDVGHLTVHQSMPLA